MVQVISNTTANSTAPTRGLTDRFSKKKSPVVFGVPSQNTPSSALTALSKANSPKPLNQYKSPVLTALSNEASRGQNTPPAVTQPNQQPQSIAGTNNISSQLGSIRDQVAPIQARVNEMKAAENAQPNQATQSNSNEMTYPGLVRRLTSTSTTPNRQQNQSYQDLRQAGQGNEAIGRDARQISDNYAQQIARVGQLGAGAVAGNLSTGTNVVGSGNAAIASQSASARIAALSQAQQAALQGTSQQLQGQAQAATAFGQGFTGANTQQQTAVSGLGTAAGLGAPVQIAPGSTLASPLSGDTVAGGLGGYANYQTAEQVMGLIRQYPDAGYIYDQTKTPQENLQQLQSQIQGSPTYQKATFGVPGQGTIAGAAAVTTAQQGYQQSYQNYTQLETQITNADILGDNLVNIMQQSGINPTDARFANSKIKDLQRQFNSEQRAAFDTAIKEVQAAYGNIIVSGGGTIPTEATEAYNTIINPDASVGAIMASIEQLHLAGQTKLQAQGNQVQTYLSQLQAASTGQGGGGGSTAGGGFAEEW